MKTTENKTINTSKGSELELTSEMISQIDKNDNLTYNYLLDLLNISSEDADEKFPWNISIISNILEMVACELDTISYHLCRPCVITNPDGSQQFCSTDCKREQCICGLEKNNL